MSTPEPVVGDSIDLLQARLKRLASDPRARLLPEGRAIAAELLDFLADMADNDLLLTSLVAKIDAADRRLAAVENALALIVQHGGSDCDD